MSAFVDSIRAWMSAHPQLLAAMPLLGALLLTLLLRWFVITLNAGRYGWQRRLRNWLGVDPDRRITELAWLAGLSLLAIWGAAGYATLQLLGNAEVAERMLAHLFNDSIVVGGLRIAPFRIGVGVFWFAALVTFTRWFGNKLEHGWLPRTGIEPGTREAVATVFSYLAFIVAALIAVVSAGFDLSKLAIVAGALSVGVGFGLQDIVKNFVSGLVLLFERPVRSGDYITVGHTSGFVRKVRIRSTEIETWDRESIIVPNSDLLSNHVKNLNLRDDFGRISVAVGVAYGSDTAQVKQLLIEAANAHELTVKEGEHDSVPGPRVFFMAFGDSALQFELRVFIAPVVRWPQVASDLRFDIDAAFRSAGIVIPFPQREVWLRAPEPDPPAPATPR
jgi:small-conductance mechanosensitive channel